MSTEFFSVPSSADDREKLQGLDLLVSGAGGMMVGRRRKAWKKEVELL